MASRKANHLNKFLILNLIATITLSNLSIARSEEIPKENKNFIDTAYLESGDKLEDYILDTDDTLRINFTSTPEFSGSFTIDENGEIYLPRINQAYIRGLTIKELERILEKRYEEFLLYPNISIRITKFKPIRILIKGEVNNPGLYKFAPYNSLSNKTKLNTNKIDTAIDEIKRSNDRLTSISNALFRAGGLTSFSDISKIEIVRDIPEGNGGGKKRTLIDFNSFLTKSNSSIDIRLYDGDYIYIPRLSNPNPSLVPLSVLSGLSPKFIKVSISGKIETPGDFKIPLKGSLSDVMNLSGPVKPLSGRIYLIRYKNDGTLLRRSIQYSSIASPGSKKNPYLIDGDLISVKDSFFGKFSSTVKAVSDPFVGIYATKEIIQSIN